MIKDLSNTLRQYQYISYFLCQVWCPTLSDIFSRNGMISSSATCKNLLRGVSVSTWISAALNVKISMAVSLVCFLDGTNTITGFLGACLSIAWYVGLAMAMILDMLWLILYPCMCSSRGTGLTLGWKLKKPVVLAPSHWETSLALEREELRATILMLRSSWDDMYLIREQITSNTGCK